MEKREQQLHANVLLSSIKRLHITGEAKRAILELSHERGEAAVQDGLGEHQAFKQVLVVKLPRHLELLQMLVLLRNNSKKSRNGYTAQN